jgi:hypothetical protein
MVARVQPSRIADRRCFFVGVNFHATLVEIVDLQTLRIGPCDAFLTLEAFEIFDTWPHAAHHSSYHIQHEHGTCQSSRTMRIAPVHDEG